MTNFRKTLLAGTAVIALGAFAPGLAHAAANDFSLDADNNGTDYEVDIAGGADLDGAAGYVAARDLVVNATGNLIVDVTTTIGDGSDADYPAITTSADDLTFTIINGVGGSAANDDDAETLTIDGDVTKRTADTTLNLTIVGESTDAAATDTFNVDIDGDVDLGDGTLTITADANDNNPVNVNIEGDLTAGATVLQEDGANNSVVTLTFDGTTAQTVSGTIDGETDSDGDIVVDNAAGVTFEGTIGAGVGVDTITIEKAGGNSSATFENAVTAVITLGGDNNATDENTAVFDSTNTAFTVTGAVTAASAANETDTVTITGDDTVTFATAFGGGTNNIEVVNVNATSSATFDLAAQAVLFDINTTGTVTHTGALTATSYTVDGAATIALTAAGNAVTNDIDIDAAATVTFADGATQTTGGIDNVSGADDLGTVTFAGDATVAGSLGATNDLLRVNANGGAGKKVQVVAVDAKVLNFGDDGVVEVSGDYAVDSTTTSTTGEGTLEFDAGGAQAATGNVGSANLLLKNVLISGAATDVTLTGDVYATNVTFDDGDAGLILADGSDIHADIVATGDEDGDLTFAGDSVVYGTIGDLAGAGNSLDDLLFTTASGETVDFRDDVMVDGFDASGATDARVLLRNGVEMNVEAGINAAQADTTTFAFELSEDNTAVTEVSSAGVAAFDLTNARIEAVVMDDAGFIADGTVYTIFDGNAALTDPTNTTVIDNSRVLNFTWASTADTGNDGTITANRVNTLDKIAATTVTSKVGKALEDIGAGGNAAIDLLQGRLAQASSDEAVDNILESVAPTVDGGATVGAVANVTGSATSVNQTRLASLRSGDMTGMAAGNVSNGLKAWGQVFGTTADQDRRDGVDGFDADTWGVSVGVDSEMIIEDAVLGISLTYADTDVDSKNINNTKADINTYQIALYGDYDLDERTFVSGQLGYGNNDIDQTRHDVGGLVGTHASADFDADVWFANVEIGHDFYTENGVTLTPSFLVNYQYIDTDDYTETGAGGMNLHVDTDAQHVFEVGLGVDASWMYQYADGSYIKPKVSAGYRYDIADDKVETSSNFTGATGTVFKAEGADPAQHTFNIGAGVTYFTTDNWELTAEYDFELKSDYDAHSGVLRAAYKF